MKFAAVRTVFVNPVILFLVLTLVMAGCGEEKSAPPAKPAAPAPAKQAAPAKTEAPVPAKQPAPAAVKIVVPSNPAPKWDAGIDKPASEPYQSGELAGAVQQTAGRTKVRKLMSFEDSTTGTHDIDGKPIPYFTKDADGIEAIYVQDNGVTDGKWCARLTALPGPYGGVTITGDVLKGWEDYDYFAVDVYVDEEEPLNFVFEIWDDKSTNYATRCTWEEESKTHKGSQTFYYHIARAVRNSKKEGRSWEELEAEHKINLSKLTKMKIICQAFKDRPVMYWIDNLRLMQEDAVKPSFNVALPKNAKAFNFGSKGTAIGGFTTVSEASEYSKEQGFGFASTKDLQSGGKGWPDLLAGTYVIGNQGSEVEFNTDVPNGEYRVWLCAGMALDSSQTSPQFRLQVNDKTIYGDSPSYQEYDSEKYLYKFMWTQYSMKPHALWLDFVNRMFPVHQETMRVTDGKLTIRAVNYFLSGIVIVPVSDENDFRRMSAKLQMARVTAFEKNIFPPTNAMHPAGNYAGDYALWVPQTVATVEPSTIPSAEERGQTKISTVAAPGQSVIMNVAIAPFKELGACELKLAELKGATGSIPVSAMSGSYANYRYVQTGVEEMVMLPSLALNMEKGITQRLYVWLTVPTGTKPGKYSGEFTFVSEQSASAKVPVDIEVLPFKLSDNLPVATGMFYGGRVCPVPPSDRRWQIIREQVKEMRRLGMTATCIVDDVSVASVNKDTQKAVMSFDDTCWKIAREAGMGRNQYQKQIATYQLVLARRIARIVMPRAEGEKGSPVDLRPGSELGDPNLKPIWMDAMKQYKAFLDSMNMPYMVWSVDEPREVPNAWNRTVKDTVTYLDWMGEAGLTTRMVTPMGDNGGGSDNLILIDHCDIMMPHANKSCQKLVRDTLAKGKELEFYNCGMSRLSWGFMVWRNESKGRWQWHWSFVDNSPYEGYAGSEWYCPFTKLSAYASNAAIDKYPGGVIYQSAMLNIVEGTTDLAYLFTLEDTIKSLKAAGKKADKVQQAEKLLSDIRNQIPEFSLDEKFQEVSRSLDTWRTQIAGMLKLLNED